MVKIAIIGAGHLGSRHLQSLSNLDFPTELQVVDPSLEALAIAEARLLEVLKPDNNVSSCYYLSDLDGLSRELDIVIVATSSSVRRKVIEKLLATKKVKYLILEKVLFQSIEDYEAVGEILKKHHVKAWVNCPRRMFPFYQQLKESIANHGKLTLEVVGNNWGLGCNSIHLIDLFAYLTDNTSISINADGLDKIIINSKRAGYSEFTGSLSGRDNTGNMLLLTSYAQGSSPIWLFITTSESRYLVQEGPAGKILYATQSNNWITQETNFQMFFQSQLSHLFVKSLIETGSCSLTSFEESVVLHKHLLNALLLHMQRILGEKIMACPIT